MKTVRSIRTRRSLLGLATASILGGSLFMAGPAMAVSYSESGAFAFSYEENSGEATLAGYSAMGTTKFTIPSLFTDSNGAEYDVVAVGGEIPLSDTVEVVTVPATVTYLAADAFLTLAALTDVYFLGDAPTLGSNALGSTADVTVHYLAGAVGFNDEDGFYGYTAEEEQFPVSDSNIYAEVLTGTRAASVGEIAFGSARFSHADQDLTGTATLTVDDSSGTGAGWRVSIQSSDLTWQAGTTNATSNPSTIPASNLSVIATDDVQRIAGTTNAEGFGTVGNLGGPVLAMSAGEREGEGTYTLPLRFTLTIPADSHTGKYTGVLTTTMSVNP
jgi:hypothetical protein